MKSFLVTMVFLSLVSVTNSQPSNLRTEPLTDWKKVYDLVQNGGNTVFIKIENLSNENDSEVSVYFVDDGRWYRLTSFHPKGTYLNKEDASKTTHVVNMRNVGKFYRVPGPDAKILLLGSGKPQAEKITVFFRD